MFQILTQASYGMHIDVYQTVYWTYFAQTQVINNAVFHLISVIDVYDQSNYELLMILFTYWYIIILIDHIPTIWHIVYRTWPMDDENILLIIII